MHQQVGCGVDQGFTRAEHSYCLEYKAGGVGGVGGHENKVGGLRNSRSLSSLQATALPVLDTVCVYGHGLGGVGGVGGHENKVGGAAEFAILVHGSKVSNPYIYFGL